MKSLPVFAFLIFGFISTKADPNCTTALVDFEKCIVKAANDSEELVKNLIEKYKTNIEQCFIGCGCDVPKPGGNSTAPSNRSRSSICRAGIELKRQQWLVDCVNGYNDTALLPPTLKTPRIFSKRHFLDPQEIPAVLQQACNKSANNISRVKYCIFKIFDNHSKENQQSFDALCSARKSCLAARDKCKEMINETVRAQLTCQRMWMTELHINGLNLTDGLETCDGIKTGFAFRKATNATRPKRAAPPTSGKVSLVAKTVQLPAWKERPMDSCGARYFYSEYLRM